MLHRSGRCSALLGIHLCAKKDPNWVIFPDTAPLQWRDLMVLYVKRNHQQVLKTIQKLSGYVTVYQNMKFPTPFAAQWFLHAISVVNRSVHWRDHSIALFYTTGTLIRVWFPLVSRAWRLFFKNAPLRCLKNVMSQYIRYDASPAVSLWILTITAECVIETCQLSTDVSRRCGCEKAHAACCNQWCSGIFCVFHARSTTFSHLQ